MKIKNLKTKLITTLILSFNILIELSIPSLAKSTKTQINILLPASFADSTKSLVKTFNKSREDIEINITRGPLETEALSDIAISSLLLDTNPYDIILLDVTWLPKYAHAGWLKPLDEMINEQDWLNLTYGARLGNKYKKIIYRWPFVADIGLLYWRKDLMQNPPRTFKELETISLNLQQNKKVKYGYVWQGRQYEGLSCVFLEVIKGYKGKWWNGKQIFSDIDSAKKAFNWLNYLIISGITPKSVINFSETESLQTFKSGEAAFMRNWPYAWAELQKPDSFVKGNVGVTIMVSETGDESTSTLGSWGFSILKSSKNPKTSMEVIRYLTQNKFQRELFLKYGYTPTNKQVIDNKNLIINNPIIKTLSEALTKTSVRPVTPLYAQISDILQRELSSLLTGEIGTEMAIQNTREKSQYIINSAGK